MQDILAEPRLLLESKGYWRRVLDHYADRNIPFGDAQQVETMRQMRLTEIISFDTDFDRVPGIVRIEP